MNTKAVKSFGLALMLAAGVLAVLLALGTFSPQKAAAQSAGTTEVSPTTLSAGAPSFFRVTYDVTGSIFGGEEIVVTLDSFGLPDTIDAALINIRTGAGETLQQGTPAGVDIDTKEGTVTLQLPTDLEISGTDNTITFLRAAGISAPLVAGAYDVNVTYGSATTQATAAAFTVSRSVSIDPKAGDSGTEITVTGAGFTKGDVNIYVTRTTGTIDPGNQPADTIAEATASGGAFTATIVVEDNLGTDDDEIQFGANLIQAVDAAGTSANAATHVSSATFTLTGKVTLTSTNLVKGDKDIVVNLEQGPPSVGTTAVCVTGITIGEESAEFDGASSVDLNTPATVATGTTRSAPPVWL